MTFIRLLLMATLAIPLLACSTLTRQQLPPERPLPDAAVVPTASELLGNPTQVMLQIHRPHRDDLGLQKELTAHYQAVLLRQGITLNNLSAADQRRLEEEIARAELHSRDEYRGRQSVNYYLRGTLVESSFAQTYSDPIWCPFCEDNRAGTCSYEQKAELTMEVFQLPSNQRIKSWRVSDSDDESYDAFGHCNRSAEKIDTRQLYQSMQQGIQHTLKSCLESPLSVLLAPEAYITQYYSDGEKHYFEISAGSGASFRQGETVELYRLNTTEQGGGAIRLGEASVSSLVEPRRAIIESNDRKLVNSIRRYDLVKIKREPFSLGLSCYGHIEEI